MNEFSTIKEYFLQLTKNHTEAQMLANDTASLIVPDGYELVISSDTLNEGVHFMDGANPRDVARKALRANISDIYASGGIPYAYQLNIAFPTPPDKAWLKRFTETLLKEQNHFDVFCSGGDTTSIYGKLSISITMMGVVKKGQSIKRSGAQVGDLIVLNNTIGDAYIGLKCLQGLESQDSAYFIEQYQAPNIAPCADETLPYINAMMDVSDGLVADVEHICRASGVSAEIKICDAMFSAQTRKMLDKSNIGIEALITGGDDYALLMAVAPEHIAKLPNAIVIGEFTEGQVGVKIFGLNGEQISLNKHGWTHF